MAVSLPQQGAGAKAAPKQVVDPRRARRKGWIMATLALLFALAAGQAAAMYLNQLAAQVGTTQPVVVAAKVIPAQSLITPDMLKTIDLPIKYLSPTYILSIDDLVDGRTSALINLSPGEYIQQNMISKNAGLEKGMQATTINVNPITSVGNSVRQGNYVDIVVSYKDKQGQPTTEVLLQNIKILAVNNLLPAQGGTGGQTYLPAGSSGQVRLAPTNYVTLELTPEQVLLVTHAENFADELRLVMRRLDDQSTPRLEPVQVVGGDNAGWQHDETEYDDAVKP